MAGRALDELVSDFSHKNAHETQNRKIMNKQKANESKIHAGFVGFGEVNTPREIIERKCRHARQLLENQGINLVWTEPVSDDPAGKDVERAAAELAKSDFDLLVVCLAGWIPSHAVIRLIDRFRHKPMLLWGLSGWKEGKRLVTTADQAGTSALRKTMQDMGFRFKYVVNYLGAPPDLKKIMSFARAAQAARRLRGARIGMMGYRDMNLYATLHDGVSLRAKIGPEVEIFEMLEMVQRVQRLDRKEVRDWIKRIRQKWKFKKPAGDETIRKAVELYLAVKAKTRERGYEAVSLIDVDGVKKLMHFPPAPVFMLLADEDKVCTIPENDTMGAVTQLMTRYLTGQAAAYMEFYEFMENSVLMGVPDYVPSEIVSGPVVVMPTAFGKLSEGLLNVSRVKSGKVTLCRLGSTGDKYSLHLAVGKARRPRKWEEAGWAPPAPQLPSLEIMLDGPMENFIQQVLGQHYIISYGDNTAELKDLCRLLDITVVE
jgi:L-fucose isomerase-like protein